MQTTIQSTTPDSIYQPSNIPELPVSPDQALPLPYKQSILGASVVGAAGAGIIAGIMYTMWSLDKGPKPMFLDAQQTQFGEHGAIDHVAGVSRFAVAGAIWGALFGGAVRQPNILKGMAFGFLPSLFVWTVIAKKKGEKPFFGFDPKMIAMPVIFNSLIWGTLLGKAGQYQQFHPTYGQADT